MFLGLGVVMAQLHKKQRLSETERKNLREIASNLVKFPEENPNPVMRISENGEVLYANSASQAMLDFWQYPTRKKVPGSVISQVDKALATGHGVEVEVVCPHKTYSMVLAPIQETRFVHLYGLDITQRKRLEQNLQESEERFRLMMQQSPSVIELYDLDGLQIEVNHAYEVLWGFPASHTVGLFNVLKSEEVKRRGLPQYLMKAYRGETVSLPEYEYDSRGPTEGKGKGRVRWLKTVIYPLKDEAGAVKNIVITHEDITERKKAEEETLKVQQALTEQQRYEKERIEKELSRVKDELIRKTQLASIGQVSASIAHDLRNPLACIRNANYLIKKRLNADSTQYGKSLEIIDQEVEKADTIITNLLSIARRRPLQKERVCLDTLIQTVYNRFSQYDQIQFDYQSEIHPFLFEADPNQIDQVLSNLITNALQAIQGQGRILVTAKQGADFDTICVQDSGTGIPNHIRDRIFEPLVTTKARGTGLGLTICQQIVESHGGLIMVGHALDRGTVMQIMLPRRQGS
jgi:PAS domain S-box-containing protein